MSKQPPKFNLNAVEREEKKGPFVFLWGDPEHEYQLIDPQETDFRDLMPILHALMGGDIVTGVNLLFTDQDDTEAFWETKVTRNKLNALAQAWLDHYDLNPGEASASPPFSNRTARRSKQTSRSGR